MSAADVDGSDSRAAPHPAIETSYLESEAVLLDERTGTVHHLNSSASAVWLLLDGKLSIDEVAGELSEILGVPAEDVLPDVQAAVADFLDHGLLADGGRPDMVGHAASGLQVLPRPPDP